jgi:hypothetical protein
MGKADENGRYLEPPSPLLNLEHDPIDAEMELTVDEQQNESGSET